MAGFWYQSNTQIHDPNGRPYIGARAYFYLGGTTTPITVYKSFDLGAVNAHPNPLKTDGNGFWPPVFLDEADGFFRVRITTAQGVVIADADGIPIIGPSGGGGGGGGTTPVDADGIFATGDMMIRYGEGLRPGFVRCNSRSIGSALSGATERANADCRPLFEHLWNADPNLTVGGGRGANAAADWTANKPLSLPDWRGRALIGLDNMGSTAAGRIAAATVLGWTGGAETHTLTINQMPSHGHQLTQRPHRHNMGNTMQGFPFTPGNFGGFAQGGTDPSQLFTQESYVDLTLGATGGGAAHNNVQPSKAMTIYIRL